MVLERLEALQRASVYRRTNDARALVLELGETADSQLSKALRDRALVVLEPLAQPVDGR